MHLTLLLRGKVEAIQDLWLLQILIQKILWLLLISFLFGKMWIQDKIGIIGICGWGGMALNAAALDTRIKATVAIYHV